MPDGCCHVKGTTLIVSDKAADSRGPSLVIQSASNVTLYKMEQKCSRKPKLYEAPGLGRFCVLAWAY